jgi:hypothetical protein
MKRFVFVLVLVTMLLAACGGPAQAPATTAEEKPRFTDADIDKAQLITASELKELIGREGGIAPTGQNLPALPDNQEELNNQGELSTQAVLPYVSGIVYYIRHDPNLVSGNAPYSIISHSQLTDNSDIFYSGEREIQSVAGDHRHNGSGESGYFIVVSMRETTDPASDFDIFLFEASGQVYLLTDDTVDNTNVSRDYYYYSIPFGIVYEQPVAGKASVVLRRYVGPGPTYDTVVLSHPDPQRQPSISYDGKYITFVRDLSNGTHEIVKYTVATNTYVSVASSSAVLEYPSISRDGQKVMWLENGQRDTVKLKNLTTGVTQNILSDTFIAHPFLTANGLFMTYQTTRKIVVRDLITGQNAYVATTPFATVNLYGPIWAQEIAGKPVLKHRPAASLRPHEALCFLFNSIMFDDTVERAFTFQVNGQVHGSSVIYCFTPSPPLEFGDVVSWSLSSEARSLDGQRLDPVTGTSVVNLPPNGELTVRITGATSLAPVTVTNPRGSIRIVHSTTTLTDLIRGTYTIAARAYRTNSGKPTCRIYTPDFFSQIVWVDYSSYMPKVDVVYRSEPCGF